MVNLGAGLCQCYVRGGETGKILYEASWPGTTPIKQFFCTVASYLSYSPYTIELVLQSTEVTEVFTSSAKGTLVENGLLTGGHRNNLVLQGINGKDSNIEILTSSKLSESCTDNFGLRSQSKESQISEYIEFSAYPESSDVKSSQGPGDTEWQNSKKDDAAVLPVNEEKKSVPMRELHATQAPSSYQSTSDFQLTPSTSINPPTIGFVGLVNQAMTCYLNSLLQALYMTPEFRNALYKWQYEGSKPSKSIPFQLQRLFLKLQTSSRSAVETTELTLSFGWGTGDVWHQHDVQELCRVMFDALEQVFQNTSQANLINQLYQGKMIDYVKCLECGREKSREDTYLDIPLPVRPFGSTVAYTSVEEAMEAFVKAEILDGNNQYDCESCSKKVNAHKGLKFSTLPYLLTLHLKRFDFDYSTMHRIKLNDKVTFPMVLDLSRFVTKPGWTLGDETPMEEGCVSTGRADDSSTADSALDDDSVPQVHDPVPDCTSDTTTDHPHDDDDEGIEMSGQGSVAASGSSSGSESDRLVEVPNARDDLIEIGLGNAVKSSDSVDGMALPTHLYELYAIMIHSGSASGGHYYAYIRDFVSDQWFCFNDQSVTPVTSDDIEKTYGGGPSRGYYSGVYSSSTNAYMLMYRLIDKDRNCHPMIPEEFPPHIEELVEQMKEDEQKEKALRARQEQMVKVKIYWNDWKCKSGGSSNFSKLCLYKDATLQSAFYNAYQNLQLKDVVPEEQCRLVAYNHAREQMIMSFDGREEEQIGVILTKLKLGVAPVDFLVESRRKDQTFLPYSPTDIVLPICSISFEKEEVISLDAIQVSPNLIVGEFKNSIKKWLPHVMCGNDASTTDICLILYEPISGFQFLSDPSVPINTLFLSSIKVFVTPLTSIIESDLENGSLPNYQKFLNKIKNIVVLNIILPDISDDSLEEHLIPPLSEQRVGSLNNNKAMDERMGDSVMTVVTSEEEAFCSATTSDQSTSEDSSLDSERTIIGEPAVENQSSSPSDSDHQMSSPSLEGNVFEPFTVTQQCDMNGDVDWDSPQHSASEAQITQTKSYYLKVTPYTQNNLRMLKVVVDQGADWHWVKTALEPYIGIEVKYVTLSELDSTEQSLVSLSEQSYLTLKLHRPLRPDEFKFRVYQFDPDSDQVSEAIAEWIVTKGQTIGEIKKGLLKYLERINATKVPPCNRCRLRRKSLKSVERPLADSETFDDYSVTASDLFIEEVDGDPNIPPRHKLVFTKRYHPRTRTTEPFVQISYNTSQPNQLEDKLLELSSIPQEHLKASQALNQFPWELGRNIMSDYEWKTVTEIAENYRKQEISLVLLYMDDRENTDPVTESIYGWTQEVTVNRPTPSPRREKPLKIYLDNSSTTSSPAREEYDL